MEPGRTTPTGSQPNQLLTSTGKSTVPSSLLEGIPSFNTENPAILVPRGGGLSQLPPEIIETIFRLLSPQDLSCIGATCRRLANQSKNDRLWQDHVQKNVPGCMINSPSPYESWRDVYIAYDPYWFLTKHKLWFSDFGFTGRLILACYDPMRACIEGYRLVAEPAERQFQAWEHDDAITIHSWEPMVVLHQDLPVVRLDKPCRFLPGQSRYSQETTMDIGGSPPRILTSILLAQPCDEIPSLSLWPPAIIPAQHRTRSHRQWTLSSTGRKPQQRSHVSDQTFRIRFSVPTSPVDDTGIGLTKMEHTYATLDPKLYTPTASKPYRGIWAGDYHAHGCEFLLLHQPDDKVPFDENSVVQREGETVEDYSARKQDERICRGRIEAIKLTGDPNVPRGEYTFLVEDLGKDGLIRVAEESQFRGARIVRSKGHVAERMFRNHTFINSQLIMISTDLLAQYWEDIGQITFFRRVNIDDFLNPYDDRMYR